MQLVASSNSSDVTRSESIDQLVQRAVLTRMVCRELGDRRDGKFSRWRTDTALSFLMQWINDLGENDDVFSAADGVDSMVVPDDCRHLIEEISDGARVCDALAMLQSADTETDVMNDMICLEEELEEYKKKHDSPAFPPPVFLR